MSNLLAPFRQGGLCRTFLVSHTSKNPGTNFVLVQETHSQIYKRFPISLQTYE